MRIILLFILLQFTSPNGEPIFIVRDQVVAVAKNTSGDNRARSQITTSQGVAYVRESQAEIVAKLSAGD